MRDRGVYSAAQHQGLERPPAIRVDFELVRDAVPDAVQDVNGPETTIFLGEIVPVALEIVRVRVNEIDHDGAADRPRSASILRFGDRDDALLAAFLFLVLDVTAVHLEEKVNAISRFDVFQELVEFALVIFERTQPDPHGLDFLAMHQHHVRNARHAEILREGLLLVRIHL